MASRAVQRARVRRWLTGHPLQWGDRNFEGCREEEFLALDRPAQQVLIVKYGLRQYADLIGYSDELADAGRDPIEDEVPLTNEEVATHFGWGAVGKSGRQQAHHNIQGAMRKLLQIRLGLPVELASFMARQSNSSEDD